MPIYQTDPSLGPYINKWGCDLMSIAYLASVQSGKPLTTESVLRAYQVGMKLGYIQKEEAAPDGSPVDGCDIYNYPEVFKLFGGNCKAFKFETATYQPASNELEILKCKRDGVKGVHFMAGNGKANSTPWQAEIAFDPIEYHVDDNGVKTPGSWTQGDGWIVDKRILIC